MSRSSFRQPPPDTLTDSMVWDRRGAGTSLNPYPAGSLVTTVGDMGKFIIALLVNSTAGAILKPADRELLFERHYSAHTSMPGLAYGFFEGSANGHRTLHHTGDGRRVSIQAMPILMDCASGGCRLDSTEKLGSCAEQKLCRRRGHWRSIKTNPRNESAKGYWIPVAQSGNLSRAIFFAGDFRGRSPLVRILLFLTKNQLFESS